MNQIEQEQKKNDELNQKANKREMNKNVRGMD